jgi:hypothetical protein
MSTIPTRQPPDTSTTETVEQRFRRLEATWQAAVCYSSSPSEHWNHPAFREIISLGEVVVPLMLRDLEQAPHLWVWALPEITGADPEPEVPAGNVAKKSEAWLRWGKEQGYRW